MLVYTGLSGLRKLASWPVHTCMKVWPGNAKEITNIFHGPLRGMDADSNMLQLKRPSILRSYVNEWLNVWLLVLRIMG